MKILVNVGLSLISLVSHANTELVHSDENDDDIVCIISERTDSNFVNMPSGEHLKDDFNDLRNMYMLPFGQMKNNCQDLCIRGPKGFFSKMAKAKIEYH